MKYENNLGVYRRNVFPHLKFEFNLQKAFLLCCMSFFSTFMFGQCDFSATELCTAAIPAELQTTTANVSSLVCNGTSNSSISVRAGGLYRITIADGNSYSFSLTPTGNNTADPVFPGVMDLFHELGQTTIAASSGAVPASAGMTPTMLTYLDNPAEDNVLYLAVRDKSCAGSWKDYTLTITCTTCAFNCAPRQYVAANEAGCISAASTFAVPTTTGPCNNSSLFISNDGGTGAVINGSLVSLPAGLAANIYTIEFSVADCSNNVSTCTTDVVVEPSSSCNSGNINLSSVCTTAITASVILSNQCAADDQYTLFINGVMTNIVNAPGTYAVSVRYTPTTMAGVPDMTNPFFNKELCWQNIVFEDKTGPACDIAQADLEYNFVCGFEGVTATPSFFDCSSSTVVANPVQEISIGDCGEIAGLTNGNQDLRDDLPLTFMGMNIPAPSEADAATLSGATFALDKIIKRTFSATDGTNTGAACSQFIYIWRPTLIIAPQNALLTCGSETTTTAITAFDPQLVPHFANPLYDGNNDTALSNDFMTTNIAITNFTSTKVDDSGDPQFVSLVSNSHTACKFIVTNMDGTASNPCGNTTKFIRRYSVLNCCNSTIVLNDVPQLIETIDNVAPIITNCPTGMAVGTVTNPDTARITSSTSCLTSFDFTTLGLVATDACSAPVTFNASYFSLVTISSGTGTLVATGINPMLGKGNYRIEVTATDDCRNISAICNYYLNVDDAVVPSVICKGIAVSVDGNGNATVCASEFSTATDNCGTITSLEVRKMDDPVTAFAACITINCTDATVDSLGRQVVNLIYRATDDCGNTNIVMCPAEIQIKTTPQFTCPADVTVECTAFDPSVANINNLGPTIGGTCGQMFTTRFEDSVQLPGSCTGNGTITRTFFLVLNGVDVSSCTQSIFIEDRTPPVFNAFDANITAACDAIPTVTNITATDSCPPATVATVTFVDSRTDGSCANEFTITRTLTATDNCGNTVTAVQTIMVSDNTAPVFTIIPQPLMVACNNVPAANPIAATDNCDSDVTVTVSDSTPIADACPNDNSFVRTYTATDNCGNATVITQDITVLAVPIIVTRAPNQELPCTEMAGFTFTPPTIVDSPCGSTNTVTTGPVIETGMFNADGSVEVTGTFTVTDDCGISFTGTTTVTFTNCCTDLGVVSFGVTSCFSNLLTGTIQVILDPTVSVTASQLTFTATNINDATDVIVSNGITTLTFNKPDPTVTLVYNVVVTSNDATLTLCENLSGTVTCAAQSNRIAGRVFNEEFVSIEDVEVELMDTEIPMSMTNIDGKYNFENLDNQGYTIAAHKENDPANGISTFDLVVMAQHVLGIKALNSPYKLIAADVNMDQTIDILDMLELRQLILYSIQNFSVNSSWRFVNADYVFPDPQNPWLEAIPQTQSIEAIIADTQVDFIAVKIGDLDCSAQTKSNVNSVLERTSQPLILHAQDKAIAAGTQFSVTLNTAENYVLSAAQFTLNFDPTLATFEGIQSQSLKIEEEAINQKFTQEGLLPFAWFSHNQVEFTPESDLVLTFTAKEDLTIAELLQINSELTEAVAYTEEGVQYDVQLNIQATNSNPVSNSFQVYQNQPNPFSGSTVIGYEMTNAQAVLLTVFDLDGKVLFTRQLSSNAGYNKVEISTEDINKTGVLYYQLNSADYSVTKKMIILE